jgi:hypothetical protein
VSGVIHVVQTSVNGLQHHRTPDRGWSNRTGRWTWSPQRAYLFSPPKIHSTFDLELTCTVFYETPRSHFKPGLNLFFRVKCHPLNCVSRTRYLWYFCLFTWASAASLGCTAACWLIVPPALDVPTSATRCPRAYRRLPHSSGGSWNLWAGNRTGKFFLNADFHETFRVLLHAANLRHGNHCFTSIPKEGVLRIFTPLKIRSLRPGLNPRNLGTRDQHVVRGKWHL